MEVHQLRYVLAVADEGSFTAAATHLRVSQSGISTQVRKLEHELGISFFDRTSRRIALTAEGERMLPSLRAAVAAVERIREGASDLRGLVVGSLRIGTVAGLIWPRLFDAVIAIHHAYPGVDLRLTESTSVDLIAQVRAGGLDVAVAAWSPAAPEGLESATVFDDALVAVVAERHPWAARRVIRPAELARSDLIALPRGTGARVAMDAMFARAGVDVQPRWEVATPAYMTVLAARACGVAIASETTLADATGLVVLRIDDARARSQLGVTWKREPGPATQVLLANLLSSEQRAAIAPGFIRRG